MRPVPRARGGLTCQQAARLGSGEPQRLSRGGASAGGVIAIILANIVAFFLMRAVGKNLDK